ncbi:hypothetical protein [Wolbachia endosymbiont (group A) of Pogonocherus hispidulus]|uniref:hypothetical protein n=1 Tax=Wolbachia endosymbiont (group A) of Pogonocherus hispidulus TaxID=3066136 RepID=UPI00333FE37F
MTIVRVSSQRLYDVIPVPPSPVIPVLLFCHPSSPYDVIPVLLSRHPSAYFFVIPVPRHWDPEKRMRHVSSLLLLSSE